MEDAGKTHFRAEFKRELEALQTIRDELKLKAHLAKADVKDELSRLEARWQDIESEMRRTGEHVREPVEAIGQKTKELVQELKHAYDSLKRKLT